MPDTALPEAFLQVARSLIGEPGTAPSQADLRRSISSSYFAAFHALARSAANSLAGPLVPGRSNKAWVEVYRGLSHGTCSDACSKAQNIGFPEGVQKFALYFKCLQAARKRADYDPILRATQKDADFCASLAELGVSALEATDLYDRTAFAAYVLITTPGARQAREIHKHGSIRGMQEIFETAAK